MDVDGSSPGWKAQPDGSLRWWDGQQWTDNYAAMPPVPPGVVAPQVEPTTMAVGSYYQLGDQANGNTLTRRGWFPTAVVIEHQERAESLARWAWMASGIGLVVCGMVLGPLGIVLGLMARSTGRQWGQPIGWGPVILGAVSTIAALVIAFFIFSGGS